jgi:hypothetical protein
MTTTPNGAPSGAPASGVDHQVKFRHVTGRAIRLCRSEQCPHGGQIKPGEKYARVMRKDPKDGGEMIEFFHPKCYDYEFEQGA